MHINIRFSNVSIPGIVSLLTILMFAAVTADASTYLEIGDEAYTLLSRLEAEGVVRSGLLNTRPLSRTEAIRLLREAEQNSAGSTAFIKSLVQDLRQRLEPNGTREERPKIITAMYANYINTISSVRTLTYSPYGTKEKEQAMNYNNNGDLYSRGSNERLGINARMEDLGMVSFMLNPELRTASSGSSEMVLKEGYAIFDIGWDLIAGKASQWWGPGYHGGILLTNNAEPFTMLELTNPTQGVLPGFLKYLGPYRFTFFVTTLEKDRTDVAEPYLWGMRYDFKPHQSLEIGLERTALLGGQGRPTDRNTWLNSFTGRGDHVTNASGYDLSEPGDQRAGFDLKLTLPFEVQPIQIYMEADGEDGYHILPSQWAYLAGLYLPRVLSVERLEFRFEWAQSYDPVSTRPSAWYTHHVYQSGYTYNGTIIGHHMGTDSRDVFTELTCRFPEQKARVSLSFDRTEHNMSSDIHELEHEIAIRTALKASDAVDLSVAYGYGWIDNAENVSGAEQRSHSVNGTITYRF